MIYMGGKSRIAKDIAKTISPSGLWWDPFCGGLSVSAALSLYGPGLVSDVCLPLISTYNAVWEGWEPPTSVSKEDWQKAKSLPDTDPRKAFIGFGCSFQAKWFDTYKGDHVRPPSRTHPKGMRQNPISAASRSIKRDVDLLKRSGSEIVHLDFLDVEPDCDIFDCIYCDPPYNNTTKYAYVGKFDHGRFWLRCQEWVEHNIKVYVSEIVCPVEHEVVWCKPFERRLGQKGQTNAAVVEKLFLIC